MTFYPEIPEKYIDPRTDFGFKHLFGREDTRESLMALINALLQGERTVVELYLLPTEHLPKSYQERNAVFDVYCRDAQGNSFIVEMQNAYQETFKARSIYYSTFPIQEGVNKGVRSYGFPAVYTICLLNFKFRDLHDNPDDERYITRVKLVNLETRQVFYDGLTYIYVELPKFAKKEDELETDLEKWLYVLSNMSRLFDRPVALQARVFKKLFTQAEIAMLSPQDMLAYHHDRMAMRDIFGITDSARNEGLAQGKAEGLALGLEQGLAEGREAGRKLGLEMGRKQGLEQGLEQGREMGARKKAEEMARALKAKGVPAQVIAEASGLSLEDVASL